MSLKDLAQQMKATGRKGDTELVHMTKREVAGLQALAEAAGGTLTKNPKTGLPEASFLESLLPSIVGLGVGFMTMNPYAGAAAGAAVGGAQNKNDPLMGALMGGLGGYGGAGLGAGFAGGSAAGAAGTAGTAGTAAGAAPVATPVTTSSIAATTPTGPGGLDLLTPTASATPTIAAAPAATTATAPTQSGGISSLLNAQGLKYGAMAASPFLLAPTGEQAEMPTEEKDDEDLMGRYEYRANPIPGGRPVSSAATGERMYFEPEFRRRMAQGGALKKQDDVREMSALSSNVDAREVGGIEALAKGGMKAGGFVVPADVVSMVGEGNTDAGYERIKRMLPGATPIKGKDGGQADTVKTSIEGKQPARVAHGEMYVPPAEVKRAGGAKKLYAMMDKVRKQATGKKKQIKPVSLEKAMA